RQVHAGRGRRARGFRTVSRRGRPDRVRCGGGDLGHGPLRRVGVRGRPVRQARGGVPHLGRRSGAGAGVGRGTGRRDRCRGGGRVALAAGRPTVLDADALTCGAEHPELLRDVTGPVLLTPHGGEFDRLTGGWDRDDRAGALRRYVAGLRDRGVDATVLLKGRVTLVDDGESTWAVDAGSSWAATAGSGDALAGVAGALLAHGAGHGTPTAWSAVSAAVAHGEAARSAALRAGGAGAPIGASDLIAALPGAISALRATV